MLTYYYCDFKPGVTPKNSQSKSIVISTEFDDLNHQSSDNNELYGDNDDYDLELALSKYDNPKSIISALIIHPEGSNSKGHLAGLEHSCRITWLCVSI